MLSNRKRNILTLVVVSIFYCEIAAAVPHQDAPPPNASSDQNISVDETIHPNPERDENLVITPVKAGSVDLDGVQQVFNRRTYFYPYRQELEMHAGVVFGIRDSSDDKDLINGILGFSYILPELESPKWHVGADLSFVGHGHLYVSKRKIFYEKSAFRPYYDYGVLHKFVPDEKLASFSNWDNYLVRLAIGFSDIRTPPRSEQLDLSVAVGLKDILVMCTYGSVWGF